MNRMLTRKSGGDRLFTVLNGCFLGLMAILVLYPLYFVVIASISDPDAVLAGKVVLYPVQITLDGFRKIIERQDIWRGYLNTILYTLLTVVLALAVTIPAGWALSRKTLPGKKGWMIYFIIPMFFSGGLIPLYNVMSGLKLINTMWSIVLPSILSVWNLFMCKTFFESSIPDGLIEAATIDGAGPFRTFLSVVIPLSKAVIAVMALYYAVGQWNSYFNAMIFLQDPDKYPLQLVLRNILITNQTALSQTATTAAARAALQEQQQLIDVMKYSLIIISSVPVLIMYPLVQKHFVKGVMIGSVKG